MSLSTIAGMEYFSVQSRLKQENELDQFKPKVTKVQIFRRGKVEKVESDKNIQGDIL